ncbi:hypothetical protein KCP77_06615 [Salmonella enterica subsp. enterica]|nr:hypothetical protein KCP77_06615 [Salmonella enterica subsp. enterica]
MSNSLLKTNLCCVIRPAPISGGVIVIPLPRDIAQVVLTYGRGRRRSCADIDRYSQGEALVTKRRYRRRRRWHRVMNRSRRASTVKQQWCEAVSELDARPNHPASIAAKIQPRQSGEMDRKDHRVGARSRIKINNYPSGVGKNYSVFS